MEKDTDYIAVKYAASLDYSGIVHVCVRKAGNRNGYNYYVITSTEFLGRKTGLPFVAKISSKTGRVIEVDRFNEVMWAISQSNKIRLSVPRR